MLDFSYLSDIKGDKPSFILSDNDISILENAFLHLKEKTGIYIDPYGKTRIYPDHQKILVSYLAKNKEKRLVQFVNFLNEAYNRNETLVADGD